MLDNALFAVAAAQGPGFVAIDYFANGSLFGSTSFSAFPGYSGDVSVAQIPGDRLAVGQGAGGSALVKIFDLDGNLVDSFQPFASSFTGAVDLAWSDPQHLAIGVGAGGAPIVNIYNTATNVTTTSFFAFDPNVTNGVDVGWVDATHLAVGLGQGAISEVKVFDVSGDPTATADYLAFDPAFQGGVHLAGNGSGLLAIGSASGADRVSVRQLDGSEVLAFSAFGGATTGVDVAWLDPQHLAVTELSGGSALKVYDVSSGSPVLDESVSAFPAGYTGGSHVGSIGLGSALGETLFGTIVHDQQSLGGKVFALFDAALGRLPDDPGIEQNVRALKSGLSLHDLAQAFLDSQEGRGLLNARDNAGFVEQLYETALGRTGDADGAAHWRDALDHGLARADLLIDFALSDENIGQMQGSFASGIFVPDADASDVARLYHGLFGRAPDAGGLQVWTHEAQSGRSLTSIAQAFLSSDEYRAKPVLGDGEYVDSLYENELGRPADQGGFANWTNALAHGATRADVAVGFIHSAEAQYHLDPVIESGWHLS